ncbi:PhoD-like phosphatase [Phormidium sp. LEGE 05292]|uniref:PhoD-like phosphatase n=1 Tax=[Phormidium] sp. LEGE 05292 TaxID=767427 RepID=UPI0018825209|nr:PhoD-like phosphatase [Phormidium sp. LEGE 05292]MBE9228254.1 PhoD-like phosphatase [Phormidium sp. LEGE 05292]
MSWTPLCDRIDRLPLILAGPILRRTEANAVTVWVALKEPRNVTLNVYSTVSGNGEVIDRLLLVGRSYTIPLGQFLHVVAVTAKPQVLGESSLQPGEIYAYDLDFGNNNLAEALNFECGFPEVTISYFPHQLPTFAMPPDDLNDLRIVHGSCRKPHGGGRDALTILDDLMNHSANQPGNRPQQLFLTGDQIYGDDVADPLLWAVTDAGNTLLGWEEKLPFQQLENGEIEYIKISELSPGNRTDIARDYAGFTAMLVNKPEKAKSHLFGLGEYFAMYLFAWSPIVWPNRFPTGEKVRKDRKKAKLWDEEAAVVLDFANDIWKVRRSLANISTYMICDDHDVTDDWFLNREWCDRVLSKPLGKRAVQNAMLAYAIFQAWGNTPEQFQPGQPGEQLLIAAKHWLKSGGKNKIAWENIAKYLAIPVDNSPKLRYQEDENTLILNRQYSDGTQALIWYYTIISFKHEVIVLDTRTWRGYIKGENKTTEPPMLLSPIAFKKQIQQPLKETNNSQIEATLVVIPTNLVSLSFVDTFQNWDWQRHQVDNIDRIFNSDVGDSWNFNKVGFGKLLSYLLEQRDRVIILTGDIHYAGAVTLNYCARNLDQTSPKIIAQLTSSAFKNEEFTTKLVHTKISSLVLQQPEVWAGWNQQPKLFEVQRIQEKIEITQLENAPEVPLLREVDAGNWHNQEVSWAIAVENPKYLPDWWYRTEWIKRQKSQPAAWEKAKNPPLHSEDKSALNPASWLGQNRWFQEGEEVVGLANFGLVSFCWSTENDDAKAVIQDIYWRSSWDNQSVVYSRYFVPLKLKTLPLPVNVIPRLIKPN